MKGAPASSSPSATARGCRERVAVCSQRRVLTGHRSRWRLDLGLPGPREMSVCVASRPVCAARSPRPQWAAPHVDPNRLVTSQGSSLAFK